MEVTPTDIDGLVLINPRVFHDERGWFTETHHQERYLDIAPHLFVQDNLSCSRAHTLRGLHFQLPPFAQSKLVSVLRGAVQDIVVDLRTQSSTYGQYRSFLLDDKKKQQLYIPRGFAHGFLALEDETIFQYKCDNPYHTASEETILYNDVNLAIDWQTTTPLVSEKDEKGLAFTDFKSPF